MPITLTGLRRTATVAENAAQATPERLDSDVTFNSTSSVFRGSITVSGLASGDVVGVANIGTGVGQISVNGNQIRYQNSLIATMSGGSGATLTINVGSNISIAATEALIEALTFTTGNAPSASRTLIIGMTDINLGETLGPADVTPSLATGTLPPGLPGGDVRIGFGDFDADGDADAVVVSGTTLGLYRLDSGFYTALASLGTVASGSIARLVDYDIDGDLDIVVTSTTTTAITAYRNTAGIFSAVTGASNPFDAIANSGLSSAAFIDVDGDGDQDMVLGTASVPLRTFTNAAGVFTEVTGSANPFNHVVGSGAAIHVGAVDLDRDGRVDLVVRDTSTPQLVVLRNTPAGFIRSYTPTDPFGGAAVLGPGSFAFGDYDNDGLADMIASTGIGPVVLRNTTPRGSAITIAVTPQADVALTGVGAVVFAENAVNAAPQLIDADVSFTTTYPFNFTGTLTVSGLLAEDRVAVLSLGGGPGQFFVNMNNNTLGYQGSFIGTVSGGVGAPLTINLLANVTGAVVDALIQNLTYQNTSNTPTANRTLFINVTEPSGDIGPATAQPPSFTESNLLSGISGSGALTLIDIDGDGDQDILRLASGQSQIWTNQGGGTFIQTPSLANPFAGIVFAGNSRPVFNDIDGDGDLDLVIGQGTALRTILNTGGVYAEVTGGANPLGSFTFSNAAVAAFLDFDRDGDLDLVVGSTASGLRSFQRTGTSFAELTGAASPFANDGVVNQKPTAIDIDGDGDGDLDLVSGGVGTATPTVWRNTVGGMIQLPFDRNPFAAFTLTNPSNLSAGDIDGDGQADLIATESAGPRTFLGTAPRGVAVPVTVTPESDAPTLSGLSTQLRFGENAANVGVRLDPQVALSPGPGGFTAGTTLSVTGLLPEDVVSVFAPGGAGQFQISGGTVGYGGQTVGFTGADGVGGPLSITFTNPNPLTPIATMIDQLIESLVYRNTSNTPTLRRVLTLNVTDANGNDLGSYAGRAALTQLTGSSYPFTSGAPGIASIGFLDLDGDGDLDALGVNTGNFTQASISHNGVFQAFGLAGNPFQSVALGTNASVAVGDFDNDGDADVVFGGATLRAFRNLGDGFVELTGGADPFGGFSFTATIRPTFGDFNGDGDADLVVGSGANGLRAFRNTGGVFTELTGSDNPFATLSTSPNIVPGFRDFDGNGTPDLFVSFTNNLFVSRNIGGSYQGAENLSVSGTPRSLSFADVTGDGVSDLFFGAAAYQLSTGRGVQIAVNVMPEIERPRLDALSPTVALTVKPLHPEPQSIDTNVSFADLSGGGTNGATLSVTGLLSGDTIGVRGSQYAIANGVLSYFGSQIGTVTTTPGRFTVQFTTSHSPDMLVEALTYTNFSMNPTLVRTLAFTYTNAAGLGFAATGGEPTFTPGAAFFPLANANDQLSGGDVDGDGDQDIIYGISNSFGVLRNDGGGSFTNIGNPFTGVSGTFQRVAIADIDGDGDVDRLFATSTGTLRLFENLTGTNYAERQGGGNPFTGLTIAGASPTMGDIDGDGDTDIVIGTPSAGLRVFAQNPNGGFTELVGGANPFASIANIPNARPVLADRNGDGALDLYIGTTGTAQAFTFASGSWVAMAAPPQFHSAILIDRDADDDIDMIGTSGGTATSVATNTSVGSVSFTLSLTLQWNLPPVGTNAFIASAEDQPVVLAPTDFSYFDPDGDALLAVIITTLPNAGTLRLDGVVVTAGQSVAATDIAAGKLVFTPAQDGNGVNYATLTFQVQDNSGTLNGGVDTDQSPNAMTFMVAEVNDLPVETANFAKLVVEGGTVTVTGSDLRFTDVEQTSPTQIVYTITSNVTRGTLYLAGEAIGPGAVFTQADIDNGLLTYAQDGSDVSLDGFVFRVSDGIDNTQTYGFTFAIELVNDTPINTVPGAQSTNEDVPLIITGVSVADADLGGAPITVTLTVANGTLTIDETGITGDVTGNGTASVTIVCQPALINAALATGITYTPTANYNGADTLTITSNDGGANGNDPGGDPSSEQDVDIVAIAVAAVDDAPVAMLDTGTTTEAAPVTLDVVANDTDIDGGPRIVTAVNGAPIFEGGSVTLGSGARVTLTGGQLVYDPGGKFNWLVSTTKAATNAAYVASATDSFSYALNGSSTTVTVTLTGIDGSGDQLRGGTGNDTIAGTPGDDIINIGSGGSDIASGGIGLDGIYVGAAWDAGDRIDGGAGTLDQVGIQGDYTTRLTLAPTSLTEIEMLVFLPGSDTRFGAPGTGTYRYDIRTDDANVAAGQTLVVQANTLRASEGLTFDGAAETDGGFLFYGGFGADVLTGGQRDDGFFFGQSRFGPGDRVDGQGGTNDQIGLQGDYAGTNALSFGANQLVGIEAIVLLAGADARFGGGGASFSYTLTMDDGNVAAGGLLIVQANRLAVGEVLTFDASAETDGRYRIFAAAANDVITGGAQADEIWGRGGADLLRGGGGNDVFAYFAASDSTAAARDVILDYASGDAIDLREVGLSRFLGSGAFTGAVGEVRVVAQGGGWIVEGDVDGNGIADLSILVNAGTDYNWTVADFRLAPLP